MSDQEFISLEEALNKTENVFIRLDEEQSAQLEKITMLQQIKQSAQERERERLTIKYGASSLQVKQMDAQIGYNRGSLQNLAETAELAKVVVPAFEPDKWRVHGLVLDERRKPLFNLTVAFYDKGGQWLRELGFACTNEKGYFVLNIPGPDTNLERYKAMGLFLTVTEKEGGKVFCQVPEPLSPSLGMVDYQEIIKGETPCQQPPDILGNSTDGSAWIVRGRVYSGEPPVGLPRMTVQLFDKENIFTESLGSTRTDNNGNFQFEFLPNKFEELFSMRPEVFLKVLTANRQERFTSEALIPKAGKEVELTIVI